MTVTPQEIEILTKVIGRFENSGDPYEGVTGNFDGMGISCGVLQWNIGSNSLQPLVRAVGKPVVTREMPSYGTNFWAACTQSVASGLAIVRGWQTGTTLKAKPAAELRAFMGSPETRVEQDKEILAKANTADSWAIDWASSRGAGNRTVQELVWFFDIVTQNGSMKNVGHNDVVSFKTATSPDKVDDIICDWLAGLNNTFWGYKDCHKNATRWRNHIPAEGLDLLILGYLRCQKSILKARGDVLNRKGTLAVREGYVHTSLFDFSDIF